MAQKVMKIDSTIRVKMDTTGEKGSFIAAKEEMKSGFKEMKNEIEAIENAVAEISNIWKGDASAAFISNMTKYLNKLKGYCSISDGTMYKLYETGMVKAKKQYVKAEKSAIEKINSLKDI